MPLLPQYIKTKFTLFMITLANKCQNPVFQKDKRKWKTSFFGLLGNNSVQKNHGIPSVTNILFGKPYNMYNLS